MATLEKFFSCLEKVLSSVEKSFSSVEKKFSCLGSFSENNSGALGCFLG
ncbi:MAG: hypothetical protein PUF07_04435 [Bacteroidales bacterium]|nr:hypothetical protein [Bacteroidales bacterium]